MTLHIRVESQEAGVVFDDEVDSVFVLYQKDGRSRYFVRELPLNALYGDLVWVQDMLRDDWQKETKDAPDLLDE